jgi:hypothetical protein
MAASGPQNSIAPLARDLRPLSSAIFVPGSAKNILSHRSAPGHKQA